MILQVNDTREVITFILGLALALLISYIPARIVRDKGHTDYIAWWIFGFFLWLPALICAIFVKDYNRESNSNSYEDRSNLITNYQPERNEKTTINNLKELHELYEKKVITKEEYDLMKSKLLEKMLKE